MRSCTAATCVALAQAVRDASVGATGPAVLLLPEAGLAPHDEEFVGLSWMADMLLTREEMRAENRRRRSRAKHPRLGSTGDIDDASGAGGATAGGAGGAGGSNTTGADEAGEGRATTDQRAAWSGASSSPRPIRTGRRVRVVRPHVRRQRPIDASASHPTPQSRAFVLAVTPPRDAPPSALWTAASDDDVLPSPASVDDVSSCTSATSRQTHLCDDDMASSPVLSRSLVAHWEASGTDVLGATALAAPHENSSRQLRASPGNAVVDHYDADEMSGSRQKRNNEDRLPALAWSACDTGVPFVVPATQQEAWALLMRYRRRRRLESQLLRLWVSEALRDPLSSILTGEEGLRKSLALLDAFVMARLLLFLVGGRQHAMSPNPQTVRTIATPSAARAPRNAGESVSWLPPTAHVIGPQTFADCYALVCRLAPVYSSILFAHAHQCIHEAVRVLCEPAFTAINQQQLTHAGYLRACNAAAAAWTLYGTFVEMVRRVFLPLEEQATASIVYSGLHLLLFNVFTPKTMRCVVRLCAEGLPLSHERMSELDAACFAVESPTSDDEHTIDRFMLDYPFTLDDSEGDRHAERTEDAVKSLQLRISALGNQWGSRLVHVSAVSRRWQQELLGQLVCHDMPVKMARDSDAAVNIMSVCELLLALHAVEHRVEPLSNLHTSLDDTLAIVRAAFRTRTGVRWWSGRAPTDYDCTSTDQDARWRRFCDVFSDSVLLPLARASGTDR